MVFFKDNKFRILTIFAIIVLCIGTTVREFQNDTFYIIKLGEYIVNNGIDMLDHFCFVKGLSYTYPHWLYDVFLYLIYNNFGYMGVYVSNILFFIILILSIYYISLKVIRNEFICSLYSILSICILCPFVTGRSQIVSMILFIWEIYFILRLIDSGKIRYCIYLCIICLILGNIHATIWLFYFILFLPFIFEKFIYYLKNKFSNVKVKGIKLGINGVVNKICVGDIDNFKLLITTIIISLFMGLLTPSKICYSYVFKIMMGSSQSYIAEHLPLIVIENFYFIGFSLVFIMVLCFTNTRVRLSYICVILGLFIMALSSGRNISLFYLIGSLFIWKLCNDFIVMSGDKTLDIIIGFICNKYVYFFVVIIILFMGGYIFIDNSKDEFVPLELYPVKASEYIKDNLDIDDVRLFNDYNYGSYLLFNDIDVFIDSRSDLYMDEFNDLEYDMFDDFINIIYNYEEKFDYYNINYVLQEVDSNLSLILYKDSNYEVIYEDDDFVLFKKFVEWDESVTIHS